MEGHTPNCYQQLLLKQGSEPGSRHSKRNLKKLSLLACICSFFFFLNKENMCIISHLIEK